MTDEAVITRTFDAPPERLWGYFTTPELFSEWFGHEPFTTPPDRITMDVRPGGEFRAVMVSQEDGTELPFVGRFLEIDEPRRLVQTLEDPENPSNPDHETLTTTLRDLGDGRTEVTYHQTGHLPPDQYPQIVEGVTGFYERLAQHLARS